MLLSEWLTLVALLAGLGEHSGLSGRPKSGSFPSLNQRQASQLHLEEIHILQMRQCECGTGSWDECSRNPVTEHTYSLWPLKNMMISPSHVGFCLCSNSELKPTPIR